MPTNPIPAGTVNFPVNMPVEMRREAGRVATMHDEALGRWVRELIEDAIVDERRQGHLDTAGQLLLRIPCVAIAALGLGLALGAALCGQNELRRPARTARRHEVVEMVCES